MSVHPNRTGGYDVRYRDADNKHRSKTFRRKRDAERFDAETKRARALGTLATLMAKPMSLNGYVEEVWAPTYGPLLAPRTREVYSWAYDGHVAPTLGHLALHAITPPVVARWQAALIAKGVGADTIEKARGVLSGVLQTAVEAGTITVNAVRAVKAPRRTAREEVRPLAPVSVEALRSKLGPRDAMMVSVLAYAGLRPGELRELRWGHVGKRTLTVNAAKTRKRRSVRLLEALAQDLREWRLVSGRPADDAPVFPRPSDGGVMSAKTFNVWRGEVFGPALTKAGLGPARPYDLRHSFASLLAHEGRSVVYIAQQLGHSAAVSLRTYQHVLDELEGAPTISAEEAIRQARGGADVRREFGG
jgi:integrase